MKYRLGLVSTMVLIVCSLLISMSNVSGAGWEGEHDTNAGVHNLIPSHRLRHVLDESSSMIHTVYLPLVMGGSTETPPPGPTPSPTPSLTPSPTLEPTPSPSPTITLEPTPEPEVWKIIKLPGFGFYPSLALDSEGKPHIGYSTCPVKADTSADVWYTVDELRSGGDIRYLGWDGASWNSSVVDTLSAGTDINPALAMGWNDYPHIVYAYYNPAQIRSAILIGNIWGKTYLTGSMIPYYVSLARKPIGAACISYLNYSVTAEWSIRFTCRTDSGWGASRFVDSVTWTVWNPNFHFHSLALANDDTPHISYYRGIQDSTARLHHATLVGGTWVKTPVDGQGTGSYSSLALDSQNHPHISYHDHMNGDLKYARWDGSQWQVETVESSGIVGRFTSLVVDQDDHPHISYIDVTNRHLKYAFWDGSQWNIEAIDDSGNVWRYTSLAMDDSGFVHISYVALEENKLGLMYATNSGFLGE